MIWDLIFVVSAVMLLGIAYLRLARWVRRLSSGGDDWIEEGNVRPRW